MTIDRLDTQAIDVSSPASVHTGLAASVVVSDVFEGAAIVGLGWTARTVRELQVIAHGAVRLAVEQHRFRSVLLEGDLNASAGLDRFVQRGEGDPRALLAAATPYLASQHLLDLVHWIRRHNEQNPEHIVRFVHGGRDDIDSPLAIEESLDDQLTGWHERHDGGIVYIGGVAHVAIEPARQLVQDPDHVVPSAGALLRGRFGSDYRAVGLTFGHGHIPVAVPAPAAGSLEAELSRVRDPTSVVRLPAGVGVHPIRVVGPHYDPTTDARHAMTGVPTTWFAAYVHHQIGHAATPLPH